MVNKTFSPLALEIRNNTIENYMVLPKSDYPSCFEEVRNLTTSLDSVSEFPGWAVKADLKMEDARMLAMKPLVSNILAMLEVNA